MAMKISVKVDVVRWDQQRLSILLAVEMIRIAKISPKSKSIWGEEMVLTRAKNQFQGKLTLRAKSCQLDLEEFTS